MKKIIISFVLSFFILPTALMAATFQGGENVFLSSPTSEDFYGAGGTVQLQSDVSGDVFAAGGKLLIDGLVEQDIMAGGGELKIRGQAKDDVRLVGGTVQVSSIIGGDLLVAGGDITLEKESVIEGELYFGSGNITLDGVVNGAAKGAAETLYLNGVINGDLTLFGNQKIFFGPKAKINGNLTYTGFQKSEIAEGVVSGEVIFKQIETSLEGSKAHWIGGFSVFRLLSMLFFGLLVLWGSRYFGIHTSQSIQDAPLKNLGIGFLVLIPTPFVAILLMVTVIGIPIAFALLACWVITLYLSHLFAAMFIGHKLVKVDIKSHFGRIFGSFALGAIVYHLIGLIPVFGWLFNALLSLTAVGASLGLSLKHFEELRKKKLV